MPKRITETEMKRITGLDDKQADAYCRRKLNISPNKTHVQCSKWVEQAYFLERELYKDPAKWKAYLVFLADISGVEKSLNYADARSRVAAYWKTINA